MKILYFIFLGSISAHAVDEPGAIPGSDKDPYMKSQLTSDRSEILADKRKLLLTTGEDKVVDLEFDAPVARKNINIGNEKVVAVTLVKLGDKRQVVFKPLGPGSTNVTIRDSEGKVRLIFDVGVTGSNLLKTASELRDLLKDIEGINIRVLGKKIIIDGEVLVPSDYGRIFSVITDEEYGKVVLPLMSLSSIALQLLSKRIQQDINTFAPNVTARVVNGQIWLEGTVDNVEQAKRSVRVAELYIPPVKPGDPLDADPTAKRLPPRNLVQEFLVINPPPPKKADKLVRIMFHFVELAKDYNKVFGFKWQPGFTSDPTLNLGRAEDGSTAASGLNLSATISSLFPQLRSAQNAGFARVLREGSVIVRSGLEATLRNESEIPFTIIAPNGEPATDKATVGLELAVTPLILGQTEDIEIDVKMDQKINAGRTDTGAPIVSNHRVTTKLYVKSNESAALAGIQSHDVQTNFNKDDPQQGAFDSDSGTRPLFSLLRSKSFTKTKSRFVIFMTPQIVDSASEASKELKKNFRVRVQ